MATEVHVPSTGESVSEATVASWLKKVGDQVSVDDPLVELETEKASVEVPSPVAGVIASIAVEEGTDVAVGSLLCVIDEGATAAGKANEAKLAKAKSGDSGGSAANESKVIDVHVPAIGESVSEGTVAQWLKAVGDSVGKDEPICELETEKATVEVPSPVAGVLESHEAAAGDDVAVGSLLCRIRSGDAGGSTAASPPPAASASSSSAAPATGQSSATAAEDSGPAVSKLLAEHGLDAAQIPATGKDGRLTKGDVLAFIEKGGTAKPAAAKSAPPPSGPARVDVPQESGPLPPRPEDPREERVRMTKLRRTIARRLKDAQNTAAMLTTFNEVDMKNCMDLRAEYKEQFEKKHGSRLGFMAFFVKAVVQALKELPAVNAEIYGDELIYKNYYDIGVAVGTAQGLVVPVLRDADKMSFAEIEGTIADFGRRARDGKLTMAEMMGGTFTVTNGGVFGSLLSTPILNPPQSGILGMHKTQPRPVAVGDKVEIRPMMYTALSYDHRIVDGREAVTFLVRVKECIEDPRRMLLEM